MSDALFLTLYGCAYLAIVAGAVDVLMWHPFDWRRTGRSQVLRLAILMAPFFSIGCIVIGLPLVLIHFVSVRPRLRQLVDAGQPRVPRRPNLGIGWLWRELRVGQQVKGVIALVASAVVTAALFLGGPDVNDVPYWFEVLFTFAMWPTFFVLIYIVLIWAQHLLPAVFTNSRGSGAQQRLDRLAQAEYNRRMHEFQQRQPAPPWDRRPRQ